MTLLINTTKKHGSQKKTGGGAANNGGMVFKHSVTKKIASSAGSGKTPFLSPPVVGKGNNLMGQEKM